MSGWPGPAVVPVWVWLVGFVLVNTIVNSMGIKMTAVAAMAY